MDAQQPPHFEVPAIFQSAPVPTEFRFYGPNSKLIVSISMADGSVKFGEGVTPDEAARGFWDAITKLHPEICRKR